MAAPTRTPAPQPIIIAVEPFGGSIRNHSPLLPLVYWDDAAVTRGDGVFETLLLRKGKPCLIDEHLRRFQRSAKLLDLPEPNADDWRKATAMAAEQWAEKTEQDAKLVWTYTRGRPTRDPQQPHPTAWLSVTAIDDAVLRQREEGVKVLSAPRGYVLHTEGEEEGARALPWLKVGAKTLNYATNMAALRWAHDQGYDDVIFTEGEKVLEGATSTVITVRGNKLRTPLAEGILAGTTQAAVFAHAEAQGWNCKAKPMDLEYLCHKADSVWLLSSVRMATRVRRINDVKLAKPDNEAELRALFQEALGA
ncbi:aminodeoxychorismate lyase [Corynebacterium pelargi]|uniref:D-alanine aminotransferase n=1 Tax=Corynebacterium pelargi TaxID=1471400 RepID=A0A410W6Y8_9CORY|nr:aminodeoxychorismate lyase [Corynebacterium pelargi]QAU51725.1 D-alanine aminotransferase [Corynebacterium pelargi]GGG80765.1 4-amino-4-deoxychorismate lyase [Corynebacterium pelargi]